MNFRYNIYVLLLCFFVLVGCRQQTKSATDTGTVEKEPRIIVINSDAAELLLAINAGSLIVGKDDSNSKIRMFKSLEKVPGVGRWSNPNIEAIVALHPDVVVTYDKWPAKEELEDKLEPFGIKVVRVAGYRIQTIIFDIQTLGEVTGKKKEAEELINQIEYYISLIKERCGEITDKKNAYFEFRQYSALGKGSGGDELLQLVSIENTTSEFGIDYPKISPEWLLEKDPDLIFITAKSGDDVPQMYNDVVARQGWKNLTAVKENKVHIISNDIGSSPRSIIGALYAAKWAYPEKFTDIDPDKEHAAWLKKYYNLNADKLYVYP